MVGGQKRSGLVKFSGDWHRVKLLQYVPHRPVFTPDRPHVGQEDGKTLLCGRGQCRPSRLQL